MKNLQVFLGLVFLFGIAVLSVWGAIELIAYLVTADKIIVTAAISIVAVCITTLSAFWIKKVEKKHEVEAQFRKPKVKVFNDFVREFDRLSEDKVVAEDLAQKLKEWQRNLLFWSGPGVLKGFIALREGFGDTKTVGGLNRGTQIIGGLILAMRKDLGLSNRGIDKDTFGAHYMLRHASTFLAAVKENPEMTTEEYAKIEKLLDEKAGI